MFPPQANFTVFTLKRKKKGNKKNGMKADIKVVKRVVLTAKSFKRKKKQSKEFKFQSRFIIVV